MNIKIKKGSGIIVNGVVSGEAIIIKVDLIKFDLKKLIVAISCHIERDNKNCEISGLDTSIEITNYVTDQRRFEIITIRYMKLFISELLGIDDSYIIMQGCKSWHNTGMSKRITILKDDVIDNDNYTDLITYVKSNNIIFHKDSNYYYIYLSSLLDDHKDLLKLDEYVLIEE